MKGWGGRRSGRVRWEVEDVGAVFGCGFGGAGGEGEGADAEGQGDVGVAGVIAEVGGAGVGGGV